MGKQQVQLSSKRGQVREHVIGQIAAGLGQGDQLPTEQSLADQLGVSKSTVRKAFVDLVQAGVIYQEQGRGTFVKDEFHPLVRQHFHQQVHMIGYVAPFEFDDRFMAEITLGVEEALDHDRFLLMSKHIHIPTYAEAEILPRLLDKMSGLILMSTMAPASAAIIRELHERRYPLVLIDRYLPDIPVSHVVSDNIEIGVVATEYLIELGHRRILQVAAGDELTSVRDRLEGYRLAMQRHGLEPWVEQLGDLKEQEQAAERLIDRLVANELPTAIFAMCDSLAIQLYRLLRERRVRVPEEVSIIGVDGNPEGALLDVPLTTVAQPKFQMGYKAARLLEDLILGRSRPGIGIQLQPKLMVRASTAPPTEKRP